MGAVLFNVEYPTRLRDPKTCTEEKIHWLIPSCSRVEYKETKDIDIVKYYIKKNKSTVATHKGFPQTFGTF